MGLSAGREALVTPQETIHGLSPTLLELIRAEDLAQRNVLDVGCGEGRLGLAIAPEVRWAIGLDRDPDAIARAELAARERGIANVEFVLADAETSDYRRLGRPIQMVVAHLCMSDAIIARAAEALPPGAPLVFAAFHADQWKETGKISRFAYSEDRLRRVLEEAGFSVDALEVERRVKEFASEAEALLALANLRPRWEADGRWANYVAYLRAGGRELIQSHLLVKARQC